MLSNLKYSLNQGLHALKINKYAKKKSNFMSNNRHARLIQRRTVCIVIFSVFLINSIFFEGMLNGIFVYGLKEIPHPKLKMPLDVEIPKSDNSSISQSPFLKLHMGALGHKDLFIRGKPAILITLVGNGTVQNVDFKLSRSIILSVPKSNHFAEVEGRGKMVAAGQTGYSEMTTRERIYNSTVTNQSSGGIMFFTNSNGSLTFLDNSMAVFKQTEYGDNTTLISAWRWS
jgi:hypothetical protein